jgi:hypothetical protein
MTKRTIVHYEIPTADRTTTKKFYSELFGWEFQTADMPGEDMEYDMIQDGGIGGGLSPLNDMVKPGDVLIYVNSEDIDTDLKKIEALGGKIALPRQDIPGYGSMAIFIDPTGNQLALWQEADKS